MSLKAALHQYLASKESVTNLVPAARIVRGKRPAGMDLPMVAYSGPPGVDEDHQGGASGSATTTITFDAWGTSDSQVTGIVDALRNVLHCLANQTIGTGDDETFIQAARIDGYDDDTEWAVDGSDEHNCMLRFYLIVTYNRPIPNFT